MCAVKTKRKGRVLKRAAVVLLIIFLLIITAALIFLFPVMRVHEFRSLDPGLLSIGQTRAAAVYDDGNAEVLSLTPPAIPYHKIPKHTLDAFISSEDKKFFKHKGLDYKRIADAAWRDIKRGEAKEGASTISQQVIKNTHLSGEKTIRRKLEEAKLARELESRYSKEKILEIYLNRIYFGSGNVGIEAASRDYFGKSAESLTLSESALLAGIIPSPATYSPRASIEKADVRRRLVLKSMLHDGLISEAAYAAALAEKIETEPEKRAPYLSNGYLGAALSEAAELTGISQRDLAEKNYKLYTYMDKAKQDTLERIITRLDLPENGCGNTPDTLGILIDSRSGGVCAYAGRSKHDLRTVKRQPASAVKPILVYAPALENNTVCESALIADERADFSGYKPQNYNDKYYGEISVRKAVETSSNIVAVKVLEYEGIEYAKSAAKKAGIEFAETDDTLALALGGMTDGITPLSLCGSYSALASGGVFRKASFIKAVYGPSGNLIYKNDGRGTRVFGEDTAYIMTDILKGTVKRGTAKKLSPLPFETAAKTGTSGFGDGELNNDAYCISYTSRHILGLWMGNTAGTREFAMEKRVTGGGLPASVSREIYENIYENAPPPPFLKPSSVVAAGEKLYASRHMPEASGAAPSGPGYETKNGKAGKNAEAGKEKAEKHAEEYSRLKKESGEKKKSFIRRVLDRFSSHKKSRAFHIYS